ncbi:MAG: twin transmembrane helix small protein [Rhabdaerophilum sp.]
MNTMGIIVNISIAAVAVVLVMGLINMLRGGSPDKSQQLMRWRVLLQFVAVLAMLGYFLIASWR